MAIKFNPQKRTLSFSSSSENIYDFYKSNNFNFSNEILSRYYLSLKTKPFVILSGISGTGKTKIAQLFAQYMCQKTSPSDTDRRIAFVPVRPDWMDNRGLIGYYNILDETYHSTKLLEILLDAQNNVDEPYFVILDEMNLAKVEHYFSDFLSILESRTPDNPKGEPITLHPFKNATSEIGRTVPGKICVPPNVFFAGTVNVDESTYMFSPKVLDRSNVIEFNEVDLGMYSGDVSHQEVGMTLIKGEVIDEFFDINIANPCHKADYDALNPTAKEIVLDVHELLKEFNLHFGYRVVNEMSRFINLALEEAGASFLEDAIDIQITQKVLPKFYGTRAKLENPLNKLLDYCKHDTKSNVETSIDRDQSLHLQFRFPRSGQKIERMLNKLDIDGYASFIE